MGSAATEIGLDLKLCAMRTVGGILQEASAIETGDGRVAKLEESVRNLEEERTKIEAFKRELPLCMHLLTDVISALKKELEQWQRQTLPRVFEEFIPIKRKFDEEEGVKLEADSTDKMNWMSSAQLWSDSSSGKSNRKNERKIIQERNGKNDHSMESKNRSGGGAFLPFKGLPALATASKEEEKPVLSLPDLSLVSATAKSTVSVLTEDRLPGVSSARAPMSTQEATAAQLSLQTQQLPRKARRCWSPELHRRFVLALQQLGGAQVATPKQIRELMKVDGLTNDEVKSHLQKYRLHTRRGPNAAASADHPAVMVGGLWVPPENYTTSSSPQSASQSGSPQSPLQLASSARAVSAATAGDSCEDEDGKSESFSWK